MRSRNRKIICVILAMIIALSGTYVENTKTGLGYQDASADTHTSCLESAEALVRDIQICTTEMLGIRDNVQTGRLSVRLDGSHKEIKSSPGFLCSKLFSLAEKKFFTSSEFISLIMQWPHELVINYIHKSDGKKRH